MLRRLICLLRGHRWFRHGDMRWCLRCGREEERCVIPEMYEWRKVN